jgi:glycine oxidase
MLRGARPGFFYNKNVKNWDVIVIGGGIIGLSLARELRRRGADALVLERGEPGREASHAAGGMLADCLLETPDDLYPLAAASAGLYPEFVNELEIESGHKVDLRAHGTILFPAPSLNRHGHMEKNPQFASTHALPAPLAELEPALGFSIHPAGNLRAFYLKERSVDPRAITTAALKASLRLGVDISSGEDVREVKTSDRRVVGVATRKTFFAAPNVVNCAGAWAGEITSHPLPTRPVKGQMLCLLSPSRDLLKHVIRSEGIYLIPRSDGRIIVGTTVEEAGFDKRTDPPTIQRLHQAAIAMIPELRKGKILEDWAGLRPGTPDGLPILGATATAGYYAATGHFRDGILLAPITAQVIAQVILGAPCNYDLTPFSPARFANQQAA